MRRELRRSALVVPCARDQTRCRAGLSANRLDHLLSCVSTDNDENRQDRIPTPSRCYSGNVCHVRTCVCRYFIPSTSRTTLERTVALQVRHSKFWLLTRGLENGPAKDEIPPVIANAKWTSSQVSSRQASSSCLPQNSLALAEFFPWDMGKRLLKSQRILAYVPRRNNPMYVRTRETLSRTVNIALRQTVLPYIDTVHVMSSLASRSSQRVQEERGKEVKGRGNLRWILDGSSARLNGKGNMAVSPVLHGCFIVRWLSGCCFLPLLLRSLPVLFAISADCKILTLRYTCTYEHFGSTSDQPLTKSAYHG